MTAQLIATEPAALDERQLSPGQRAILSSLNRDCLMQLETTATVDFRMWRGYLFLGPNAAHMLATMQLPLAPSPSSVGRLTLRYSPLRGGDLVAQGCATSDRRRFNDQIREITNRRVIHHP